MATKEGKLVNESLQFFDPDLGVADFHLEISAKGRGAVKPLHGVPILLTLGNTHLGVTKRELKIRVLTPR